MTMLYLILCLSCNRKGLKHSAYHGTPKLVVETLEPGDST